MPILYLPPSPVGYAGGAGAAEASSRNLPVLAGAYSDAARLQQQNYALGIQAEEVRQRAYSDNAQRLQQDRQFQDMGILRANEQGRELVARAQLQQGQANMQMAEFAAQQQQIQQRAELQAWVNQQDLTQKERMELERQKAAVGEVMNLPGLTADEKQELVLQLKTGIDMKTQRLKQEQLRAMAEQREAQAMENKAQAEMMNQRTALLKGNYDYVVDPDKLTALAREMVDLGQGPQVTGFNPAADAQAVADFQKRVQDEARKRGLGSKWFKKLDGTLEMAEDDKLKLQGAGKAAKDDPVKVEQERVQKETEQVMKHLAEWEASVAKGNEGKPPSAQQRQDHVTELLNTYRRVQEAVRGAQPGAGAEQSNKQRFQESLSKIDAESEKLATKTYLPPQIREKAGSLLSKIRGLIQKYPPGKASPEITEHIAGLQRQYEAMVVPPPEAMGRVLRAREFLVPAGSGAAEEAAKAKAYARKYGPYRDTRTGQMVTGE